MAANPVAALKPAPVAAPVATPTVSETAETPVFAGVKEEKFGWLPFRNRKKAEAPAPMVATRIPSATPVSNEAAPAAPATTAPASSSPAAGKPASPEVASFEIRRDDSKPVDPKKEKAEKSDREGGILSPIAKIRPPKKEIDMTGAETIIQDGEIVGEAGTSIAAAPESKPASSPQAPQVVNGVKTYSSWGDVNARSSSAADKIIGNIR